MRVIAWLAAFGVLSLCACDRQQRYSQGHGDLGEFMLQRALSYGGRAVTTNGLPPLRGDWRYIEDEFGVGIVMPASNYESAERYLAAAFGPRPGGPGWGVRDIGVSIYLLRVGPNTEVGIHPPMSDEQRARAVRRIADIVEKNTK